MKKKNDEITIRSSAAEYLTYVASVGDQQDSIEMRYEDENIWLTQKMMATLYDVDVRTINYHVKKIFSDSELQEESVIPNIRITAADGKSYSTNHYSLEMIIAVGFKVNSDRAVQFRKWVNQIAKLLNGLSGLLGKLIGMILLRMLKMSTLEKENMVRIKRRKISIKYP